MSYYFSPLVVRHLPPGTTPTEEQLMRTYLEAWHAGYTAGYKRGAQEAVLKVDKLRYRLMGL